MNFVFAFSFVVFYNSFFTFWSAFQNSRFSAKGLFGVEKKLVLQRNYEFVGNFHKSINLECAELQIIIKTKEEYVYNA